MVLRVFSFGGGVQSTAALVLAARGEIDYRTFVFANVGDDSEYPKTLAYLAEHARPFAAAHGLELVEVQRTLRDGTPETLMGRLRGTTAAVPIPVRLGSGAPARRSCTTDFKSRVIGKWLKARGASNADPATLGLGISMDEIQRMRRDSMIPWQRFDYPLITLRLFRDTCVGLIRRAGLPVPPKSACWFCPFHSQGEWRRLRREEPELFFEAARLEGEINAKRARRGKDPMWLTDRARPLAEAFPDTGQLFLTGLEAGDVTDACESGYCMT